MRCRPATDGPASEPARASTIAAASQRRSMPRQCRQPAASEPQPVRSTRMSPETVLRCRRTGRRSAEIRRRRRLRQAGSTAEGGDLGLDADTARQADADVAGDRAHGDVGATAATDAHVATGRADHHVSVALVDAEVTRRERGLQPATDDAECVQSPDTDEMLASPPIVAAGQLAGCGRDVEACRIAHLDVAGLRCDSDHAEPADADAPHPMSS